MRSDTGKAVAMPVGIGMGAGISLALTLAMCWILALLIHGGHMEMEHLGYGIMAALLLSAIAGAAFAKGKTQRRRLLTCALTGLGYYGLLLMIPLLFFGGHYGSVWETGLLILGGSLVPALLTKHKKSVSPGKTSRKFKFGTSQYSQKIR